MSKPNDALKIDEQLSTIYKVTKILFEQCNEVLNLKPGSERHKELNLLSRGLQQFVIDYEKWEKKRGEIK